LGTLPGARRHNSSKVNADVAFGRISSCLATEVCLGECTTVIVTVSRTSSLNGFDDFTRPIEDSNHMGGRDGLLNQNLLKTSISRSGPDKGGYEFVTFFDCLYITRLGVGGPGHVFFPLNAHETWMIVEPFACNRPVRSTAS
jgi:hypothetical protein